MQKELDLLRQLDNNPKAREIVEDLFSKYHEKLKDCSYSESKNISVNYLIDLKAVAQQIENDYSIKKEVVYLYFSMDKYSGKRIYSQTFDNILNKVEVDTSLLKNKNWSFQLHGDSMESMYSRPEEKLFELLEANSSLFPKSTQKYLNDKRKKRKMYDFDSVENGFKGKMLINKLSDKFRITHNRDFYKKIKDNASYENALETFITKYQFYKALVVKYKTEYSDNTNYKEFTEALFQDIFSSFQSRCRDADSAKVFSIIRSHKEIFDQFIDTAINKSCDDTRTYMLYFFADEKQKAGLKEQICKKISNNTSYNLVKYKLLSPEQQEFFFIESLRQHLVQNPNFSEHLSSLGIIKEEENNYTLA